jgi:hypothetical protein
LSQLFKTMKNQNSLISFLLALLITIPFISLAQQGKALKPRGVAMHHETLGDPYSPNRYKNQKTSPAYTRASSLFFTTQVNVNENGENILGDAANEPSIAIDPTNPLRMVIGWRQFDDVNSNFRQAGYGYTTDGGLTWTFPGVINQGIFRSDPVLGTDSEGTFYYNSLTKDDNDNYHCDVYKNVDGDFVWDEGTYAQGGDKQWMVIDKTDGIGNGNNYSFWNSYYSICAPGSFTRSIDHGNVYEDCVEVDGNPYWGTLAVGPEGELYTIGSDGFDNLIVSKSTTARDPEQTVTWDNTSVVDLDGTLAGWSEINPEGLLGQAYIDVDCSQGPGRGNVYALASVQRNSNADPCDVMFSKSTDGGQTWSAPTRINDDEQIDNYQWFGTMSVAPNGRIDAVWLDTRNSITLLSSLYYSYSLDQGETWSENERLSESFDSRIGWPNQEKMGDYYHMVSDNAGAHLAWANTLNGEQDVYYGRITIQYTGIGNVISNHDILSLSCFPNPSRDKTTIRYILPVNSIARLSICDIYGKEIKTLVNEEQTAGSHNLNFTLDELPEGYYFCRLQAGMNTETISIVKMK